MPDWVSFCILGPIIFFGVWWLIVKNISNIIDLLVSSFDFEDEEEE